MLFIGKCSTLKILNPYFEIINIFLKVKYIVSIVYSSLNMHVIVSRVGCVYIVCQVENKRTAYEAPIYGIFSNVTNEFLKDK